MSPSDYFIYLPTLPYFLYARPPPGDKRFSVLHILKSDQVNPLIKWAAALSNGTHRRGDGASRIPARLLG